jgi:rare lipoprotein A
MSSRWLVPAVIVLGLAACSSAPKKSTPGASGSSASRPGTVVQGQGSAGARGECPEGSPYAKAQEDLATRGNYTAGGLYKPGVSDSTPTYVPNVNCIPEPLVANEPRSTVGNKSPYSVLGKSYRVMDRVDNYVEQGLASYYGQKFHGRLTSNREVYDMYTFSAAHKTLPLPSFARVTNLDNGESVVVRVNDRGPFHDGRVIDLSYAAAVRLGITQRGTGRVEVRALTPGSDNQPASGDSRRARRERAAATVAAAVPARRPAAASRMDQLVEKLPPAPVASARPVAASAEHFDTWMKDNGVRMATGRPATTSAASTAPEPVSVQALEPSVASATSAAVARPVAVAAVKSDPAARALGSILLQVASFSSRDNAARALGQLSSAGIAGASLSDIVSGGRTLWRLRVPASDHDSAAELAGRIASLGFGKPQLVRD